MTETWKALERAYIPANSYVPDSAAVILIMKRLNISAQEAIKRLEEYDVATEYWKNNIYQVALRRLIGTKWIHLNIRRRDGKPILRDWRHFQWIKNQLVGEECEGVELYPAESRLNDTSNKFHIFCMSDPSFRFPFGMTYRDVSDDDGLTKPGYRQRAFSEKMPDRFGYEPEKSSKEIRNHARRLSLEEERHRLMNGFGYGPYYEGKVLERVRDIDRELAALLEEDLKGGDAP